MLSCYMAFQHCFATGFIVTEFTQEALLIVALEIFARLGVSHIAILRFEVFGMFLHVSQIPV